MLYEIKHELQKTIQCTIILLNYIILNSGDYYPRTLFILKSQLHTKNFNSSKIEIPGLNS